MDNDGAMAGKHYDQREAPEIVKYERKRKKQRVQRNPFCLVGYMVYHFYMRCLATEVISKLFYQTQFLALSCPMVRNENDYDRYQVNVKTKRK